MAKGRRMDNGRYGKIYGQILTKEFLVEEYCNKKRGPYEIAKEIGCNAHTIYTYIDHYNINRIDNTKQLAKNQILNGLTTIEKIGKTKNGTNIWLCECECGNKTKASTADLKAGKVKSCGCYLKRSKSSHHLWKGYCDISGNMLSDIRCRARKIKRQFSLTAKFLWELFVKQGKKCAISGLDIELNKTASVDRIDSLEGYVESNVQWVHRDINKMKMDFGMSRFIELCEKITIYQKGGVV